ncbi:methyltransferase domain-containing protein [Streptomyces xiamenensis]|uniref:methyltransferase domain-containing protein n=1 Tax=Streptomyces TaxID=1883 RepID=UPI000B2E36C7|nr:methyltransferase domain-containing protein [Streptomyces sp. NRRL F-2890]
MVGSGYEELVAAAMAAPVGGWDFGALAGRVRGSDPSWSYQRAARTRLAGAERLLDIDTGGGELLSGLGPLPRHTWATEGWPPNLPVARARLEPLGVTVLPAPDSGILPLPDASVDVVLNRHGRLAAREIRRVLRPGGTLLTQQVGSEDCAGLNDLLGAPPAHPPGSWTLDTARSALADAGLEPVLAQEEYPVLSFHDIGAVVHHLRLVAWQIPDFGPARYDAALRRLDRGIRAEGRLDVRAHRFLIAADRPRIPSAPRGA